MEVKKLLEEEIVSRVDAYDKIELGSELDDKVTTNLTKLIDRLTEMEKIELENRKFEAELKEKEDQEKIENRNRKIDKIWDVGKEVVKGIICFAGMYYFTKWEDTHTPTRESQRAFIKSKFFRP